MNTSQDASFAGLTPDLIMDAVETHTGLFLDGTLTPYNSYVNRVFGVTDEDENAYIVKFYRPGRWAAEAILEEHAFLADCAAADIPVIPPLPGGNRAPEGTEASATPSATLGEKNGFLFAVFPRVRARTFDIAGDEDWIRTGRVIGRLHRAGKARRAPHRLAMNPGSTTARYLAVMAEKKLVNPDCLDEFNGICEEALSVIGPLFDALEPASLHRIHGDCHRGNMLWRPSKAVEGPGIETSDIVLIDFDDMMTGPAIQDLWLLLPDHVESSMKELNLILEGYEEFCDFDRSTISLVEPLRFMRHVYYLAWCSIQRDDPGFAERNPGWGTRGFWIAETEDLAAQLDWIKRSSVY